MDDVNATIANATAATSGDDSNGLSFVPGVLATHCDLIPDALLSDATYCSPISMLAFAVLAYVVYINSLVVLEGIRIVKEIVVAKARRVLVAATPSADEATGGPFASDSVMLIVCADGHDDEAKSTDEQQTGSAAEHSEASASASKDQRALIEKLQSIVGALEPASDEEFAEALKTIKGLVEEFEKPTTLPREDALGSAARAAEEAATEAVDTIAAQASSPD